MNNLAQNPVSVKQELAVRLDALTRDRLPAPDHPDFTEYKDCLREYREMARGPVRERLDLLAKCFEFSEVEADSTEIVDVLRCRRDTATRAYERGLKTFTLSQQIDAAAAQELAAGEFWICWRKYLDDQFSWQQHPYMMGASKNVYASSHFFEVYIAAYQAARRDEEWWRREDTARECRMYNAVMDDRRREIEAASW